MKPCKQTRAVKMKTEKNERQEKCGVTYRSYRDGQYLLVDCEQMR